MGYRMNMNGEKRPGFECPDGWYAFEVAKIEEYASQKCNLMFKAKLVLASDPTTGTDIYFVADEGKRWFLKELLAACECPAAEDGVYDWEPSDVIGKTVWGKVEHKKDADWIDRDGNTQPGRMKAQLVAFEKFGPDKPKA